MNYKILVNKKNKYNFSPHNLICKKNFNNNKILVEKRTYKNYLKLKKFLKKFNYEIDIESAYRSYDEQKKLFYDIVSLKGINHALKYVQKPGYSEHQTGLAIDIALIKNNKMLFDFDINDEKFIELLHKSLYKFGFILRYPQKKEIFTEINYEPWHIRYVGKRLAKNMYFNNLCLEEIKK